jgi:hypothetical protein
MSSESVCQVSCRWVEVSSASVMNILDTTSYVATGQLRSCYVHFAPSVLVEATSHQTGFVKVCSFYRVPEYTTFLH